MQKYKTTYKIMKREVIFVAFAILPFALFGMPEDTRMLIGNAYQQFLFPVFRLLYDHLLGWSPFPSFYWLLGLWLIFLFRPLFIRNYGWRIRILKTVLRVVILSGLFYWFWGINYMSHSPQERMGLERERIPLELLEEAFCRELDLMRLHRPDSFHFEKITMESEVRESVRHTLTQAGIPVFGNPRVRILKPEGVLLRLATAGVYMPFVFEAQIDGGMHPLVQCFTMAHEMAHAFGVGHEGSCNFVAYLAGLNSDDPYLSYSTHISYWRYLGREIRKLAPQDYKRLWLELDSNMIKDIKEIDKYYRRYPDLLPLGRSPIYHNYLKLQGMKEGLGTYVQIISWVEGWYSMNANDDSSRNLK